MSIPYGQSPYQMPPAGGYGPTYRVRFEWISEAWTVFSREAAIWIGAILLYGVVITVFTLAIDLVFGGIMFHPYAQFTGGTASQPSALPTRINNTSAMTDNLPPLETVIMAFVSWIFESFAMVSLSGLAIKQLRGQHVSFSDALGGMPNLGNALLVTMLAAILYVAGFFALCVGMFVALAFMMPIFALTADGEPVLAAFGKSFRAMKNDWLTAAGFVFVWMLIYLVSAIPCYLGLLATLPMTVIFGAIAYRDMVGMPGAMPPNLVGYNTTAPSYGQPQPGQWPPAPVQPPFGNPQAGYGPQAPYGDPNQPPYGQSSQSPYGQPQQPYGQPSQPGWQQPGPPQQPGRQSQSGFGQPPGDSDSDGKP